MGWIGEWLKKLATTKRPNVGDGLKDIVKKEDRSTDVLIPGCPPGVPACSPHDQAPTASHQSCSSDSSSDSSSSGSSSSSDGG